MQLGGSLAQPDSVQQQSDILPHIQSLTKPQFKHDVLYNMTPHEWEAMREAGKQSLGHTPGEGWPKMDVTPIVADQSHYENWVGHPTVHHTAAHLSQASGSGFFDSLKHGFSTVVRNARKVKDTVVKHIPAARGVLKIASKLPVIGKYAETAEFILEKVEKGLKVAETAIGAAEKVEKQILAGAGKSVAAPTPAAASGRTRNPAPTQTAASGRTGSAPSRSGGRSRGGGFGGAFGAPIGASLAGGDIPGGSVKGGALMMKSRKRMF